MQQLHAWIPGRKVQEPVYPPPSPPTLHTLISPIQEVIVLCGPNVVQIMFAILQKRWIAVLVDRPGHG
jgi:hypothetical protein